MKKAIVLTALLGLFVLSQAGCQQTSSWEIYKSAFQQTEQGALEGKLKEALDRAADQISSEPKNVRPYVVKGSIHAIKGQYESAIETFKAALSNADIKNEKQKSEIHDYIVTCYYRSGEVNMIKAGVEYVKKLLTAEGEKEYYYYCLGVLNLALYYKLGDGFYKSEANRAFLRVNLSNWPDVAKELGQIGIPDPMLE